MDFDSAIVSGEDLEASIDDATPDSKGKRSDAIVEALEQAQEADAEQVAAAAQVELERIPEIAAARTAGPRLRDIAVAADERDLEIARNQDGFNERRQNALRGDVDQRVAAAVDRAMNDLIKAPLDKVVARYAPRNFVPRPSGDDTGIVQDVHAWFRDWTALDFYGEAVDVAHVAITGSGADRDRATAALKWAWRGLIARAATNPLQHQAPQQARYARLLDVIDEHLSRVVAGPLALAVAERVNGIRYQFAFLANAVVTQRPRWPAGDVLFVGCPLLLPRDPIGRSPDGSLYIDAQRTA